MNITKYKKLGIHIILDMFDCELSWIDNKTQENIKSIFLAFIRDSKLKVVGDACHFFGPQSFTLIVALKESHIAIHTWPEISYVSADIFVCNYSENNGTKAKHLSDCIIKIFSPKHIKKQIVER